MQSQRWEWTHTYGVHLFVASVVAVLLFGSGLVAVVVLNGGSDPDPPSPPGPQPIANSSPTAAPQTSRPPEPTPSPTGTPAGELDRDCVIGQWSVVALEDIALTGTWTLAGGTPRYEFGADGTGAIDYGTGEDATTFEFEDDLFGGRSDSFPTGRREFEYSVQNDQVEFTYLDVLGGAQMHGLPYTPNEDVFQTRCGGGTMTMSGDKGYVELRQDGS